VALLIWLQAEWDRMTGGVIGLFLLGTGATFILLADLHDEWRKLDRIEMQLRRAAGSTRPDG
jgi:hypothetical protein